MDFVNLSPFRLAATLITIPGVKTIAQESNTARDGDDGVIPKTKCNLGAEPAHLASSLACQMNLGKLQPPPGLSFAICKVRFTICRILPGYLDEDVSRDSVIGLYIP